MAEARTGCIAIIRWIWTQVKRPFSYMVGSSRDSQVVGNKDTSASLPRLPAVVPLNQETMVPEDQMDKVQVRFEKAPTTSGPSSSNHQIISKPIQFDSHPSTSSSLPSSSAVVPLKQETMVVPADQMNEVQVLFEPNSSSCLPSSPDSQVLGDLDASASLPSSSSNSEWKYDVFLSFRGPDTRKGITVDIYDGLSRRGIKTFMDDPDLQVGDAISPTLIAAIKESKFAIVILSQNYASSAWCLEELREICESMQDNRILPLFYEVDPTDVRYQKHSFGEAFTHHEISGRHKSEKVKQWRDALHKVASFSGWNTQQQYKTHKELVNVIVDFVCTKVVPDAIESTGDFQVFEATRQALDEVMNALKDDEVTAVGVYGMGGVGKTTLVDHIGVQAQKSGIFDYVTKCVVSQNPVFENLQGTLVEQLRFKLHEMTEVGRAARLREEIKRREKILIILDDIWGGFDLSRIGIPTYKELQKCNSKVLLTTRIRNVCHQMECQRKITLHFLSEQDSWALFARKAGRSFESPTFEDVAKKVAKECKGLPIALITVARALGDKDLVEWKTAAKRLMKSQTANPDDDGEAYKCIKLSYDFLKDEEYKSLFLLCCLFPEDMSIKIADLFRYAIGKGLFRDADTLQEARERAESLARHLQYSCLLLEYRNADFLRMHDVVRDAAIQIAQSEVGFLVKAGCGIEDWPRQLHEGCSAISLMRNHIRKLPEKLVCPKLQILLLNDNSFLGEIPEAFFQSPNELRVLDLSRTGISSLPQSFSLLTKLQALYLDFCEITDTFVLGKLKRLEILSMRGIDLEELSIEVGGLTNLRIFDNTAGRIVRIPPKVISAWHSLEELYIPGFTEWGSKVRGAGEETNAGFDEVTTLSKLRVLSVDFSNAKCIPKYIEHKLNWVEFTICIGNLYYCQHYDNSIYLELDTISRLPKWFCNEIMKIAERLWWHGCQRLIDIFVESEHGRSQRLKHLHIVGSGRRSITKVDLTITWVPKTPVFENLEELYMEGLDCAELCAIKFLPPGSLFNLKVLRVSSCYNWGDILLPSTLLQRLPNLEELHFQLTDGGKYMFGYEALLAVQQLKLKKMHLLNLATSKICEGPAPPAMFHDLQILSIIGCMLEGSLFTYDVARCLSQLNYLRVDNCPMLERIVEASNKKTFLPKLKQLSLVKLPMLYYESATFDIECPSLKQFFLDDCPKFSKTILLLTSTAGNKPDSDDVDDDDMDDKFREIDLAGSESDANEFYYAWVADTTAAQARRGKDIQAIPWDIVTREEYRQTRLETYNNYVNVPNSGEESGKDCTITKKGSVYYEFRRNAGSVKSTFLDMQVRNLVWATSKHDVYLMSHSSVIHWSSISRCKSEVLNVSGHIAPSETHPGSLLEGFTQTRVISLAVKDKMLVAGGMQGEIICKHLDRPGVSFCSRTTNDANASTNAVEIYDSPSGAVHFTASSNDCGVRDIDTEKFQLAKHFRFPWAVNHTSLSPNGKLLVIVGDNQDGLLVDSQTGETVTALSGHLDFSFASAWHPDGITFATGNQDKTCRVWDVRNLSKSVAVLKGNLGAIRSIRYTSDGRYMMMAEPADFVHVYDVNSGYEMEQEIDFFGEISGVSFSPDTESLFIGVSDHTYGSLLEYGLLNSAA